MSNQTKVASRSKLSIAALLGTAALSVALIGAKVDSPFTSGQIMGPGVLQTAESPLGDVTIKQIAESTLGEDVTQTAESTLGEDVSQTAESTLGEIKGWKTAESTLGEDVTQTAESTLGEDVTQTAESTLGEDVTQTAESTLGERLNDFA